MQSGRLRMLVADLFVVVLALWLLWPQHAGGYGLGHDMVFTPHQPLNAGSVGLGSSSPRAVPLDALVALAGKLLGGAVVGRLALLLPLLAAGWGAIRLLNSRCLPAMLLVGGLAVWNPYLVERLALGQWALLWAYGALPWLVRAAHRLSTAPHSDSASRPDSASHSDSASRPDSASQEGAARPRRTRLADWTALAGWLGASAITPTGAIIGAVTVLAIALPIRASASQAELPREAPPAEPPRPAPPAGHLARRRSVRLPNVALLAMVLFVQLPWLLPALLSQAAATSDPRAVAAFAARAERPGGTLASLLGLGGGWSSEVMPASRAGVLGYLSTVLVVVVLLVGVRWLRPAGLRTRLIALAGAGFVLAAAASVPGLAAVLRWAVRELPGAGLLRDGQKWLMPFVLLVVLAAGATAERLASEPFAGRFDPVARRSWRALLSIAAMALPLLMLPDAPATLRTPLTPVHYPAGWQAAAREVAGTDAAVLVLPFASYRSFDWAPGRTVIDPAPRLLPAETVVDDRLAVSGVLLAGEDRTAAAVASVLASDPAPAAFAAALAGRGVGWVLVEAGTPGPPLPALGALRPVLAEPALRLYQVPGPIVRHRTDRVTGWLVISVDLLVALLLLAALCANAGLSLRRLLHSPVTSRPEAK
ncbi:MAG: hypothetical protein ACR2N4_11455 [Jatrophihabitans sp.]